MAEITERVTFYAEDEPAGPKILHIETDGAVVNIHVGLTDAQGRQVTNISVSVEDETRGGDGEGRVWKAVVVNQHGLRLVRHGDVASRRFLRDAARREPR